MKYVLLSLALVLAGCASVPIEEPPTRAQISDSSLPPMKYFSSPRPSAPVTPNANIVEDFLELHFELESGRELEAFTRFETPVTVRVTGKPPATLEPDLGGLLSRLRQEAGIDIRLTRDAYANITIEAVSREEIRRTLPQAACFVVPNVTSLAEFRRERRRAKTNWSLLRERKTLSVFLPYDASPQETRDCLHEEIAQALGPLNDLYRLPDSVFNDDNVHTVLTGYDMLILRATYAPELRSGMSRDDVARRLPAILDRMNPRGRGLAKRPVSKTPRSWINAVQTALGPGSSVSARRTASSTALRTAQSLNWQDHRHAFSHYMVGRMTQGADPAAGNAHFNTALQILSRAPATDLHRAYIVTQTAAFAILRGDGATALRQIKPNLDVAARSENAALLATLMLLQAEALELTGRMDEARQVRLDSIGWARYGFGSDWAVRAKMNEIAALGSAGRGERRL